MERDAGPIAISPSEYSWRRRSSDTTPRIQPMLAVVDEHPLRQASFATLLADKALDFTVTSFQNEDELCTHSCRRMLRIDIIIFSVGANALHDESFPRRVRKLNRELPNASLVIVCDCDAKAMADRALALGARAYIPTTLTPSVAVAALMLVYAGGTFVPPVKEVGEHAAEIAPLLTGLGKLQNGGRRSEQLTPRQREVAILLKRGKSNKMIAYELGVRESTVKVHVREIMKKLHATSRTHAAFLVS